MSISNITNNKPSELTTTTLELDIDTVSMNEEDMNTDAEEVLLKDPADCKTGCVVPSAPTTAVPNNEAQVTRGASAPTKLTGAQKRKIQRRVALGIPYQQARREEEERYRLWKLEQATNVTNTHTTKRIRSDGSSPDLPSKMMLDNNRDKVPMTPKVKTVNTVNTISYKEAISQTRVAILHADHPEAKLSEEDMSKIRKTMSTKVKSAPEDGGKIQLTTIAKNEGWLSITCGNKGTAEWIISLGKEGTWGDKTEVVYGDSIPRATVCVAHIPGSEDKLSKTEFIKLIQKQNDISTSRWRVIKVDDH